MVVREGFQEVLAGLIAGVIGAYMLAHLMRSLVYGVPLRDPISLTIAVAVLAAGALVAYYLPARRTTAVDPAQVLRHE
jgi:putative ABC transport system permease protein